MYKAEAFVPLNQCNNYSGKKYEKCIKKYVEIHKKL